MTGETLYEMYSLLAIAKYEDRYVIPTAHFERAHELEELGCSLDFDGGPYAGESGRSARPAAPGPVAVETFHALRGRQTSETSCAGEQSGTRESAQLGREGHPGGCSRKPEEPAWEAGGREAMRWSGRRPRYALAIPDATSSARHRLLRRGTREEAPRRPRILAPLLTWWEATDPSTNQVHVRRDFDMSRKHSALPEVLDRRRHPATRRGAGRLKQRYRGRAPWSTPGELPDYLPLVLEFAAIVDPDEGPRPLQDTGPASS